MKVDKKAKQEVEIFLPQDKANTLREIDINFDYYINKDDNLQK